MVSVWVARSRVRRLTETLPSRLRERAWWFSSVREDVLRCRLEDSQGTLPFEQAAATTLPCLPLFIRPTLPLIQDSNVTASLNTVFYASYKADEVELTQLFDRLRPRSSEGERKHVGFCLRSKFWILPLIRDSTHQALGYKVVTVASLRNHEFPKNLRADTVFDVCTPTH